MVKLLLGWRIVLWLLECRSGFKIFAVV